MKPKINRAQASYEGKRLLGCIVGVIIYSIGINLFIVPAGLYSGGILGICQVIRTILIEHFTLPIGQFDIAGIIYYLINIPIFFIAYKRMGKKFFFKTLITVTLMTLFFTLVPTKMIISDTLAGCILGGIISGAGIGLVLRMGSSGGGMDIVGIILTKWKQNFSVGRVSLFVNVFLYGACLFLFDIETVLYSVIYAAVYSVAVDKIHIQNINVEVSIITKVNCDILEKEIFEELGRGITKWQAMGAYTHEGSQVLYIMMSKYEVNRMKNIVQRHDPQAFIVMNEGVNVAGHYLKKL